ncbi:hypothetical protein [Halosimplex pelagicum]|uniref:Uncharacterized protein n=1 Tax=Halosimplex pelagicum TaxID=869886 RepID=A0A7D5PG98_9EURY|nr:hypothetical protein [Halosimplex pelagicum]QLH83639.1 hypothetical protein HZS54_19270 [Halosimplex pelagicum]
MVVDPSDRRRHDSTAIAALKRRFTGSGRKARCDSELVRGATAAGTELSWRLGGVREVNRLFDAGFGNGPRGSPASSRPPVDGAAVGAPIVAPSEHVPVEFVPTGGR